MTKMISKINIHQLKLKINLGWPQKERIKKQTIWVDMQLHFAKPPRGCKTDQLDHTLCYNQLIEQIKEKILPQKFRLIERVADAIYQIAKEISPKKTRILVNVTKKPLIADLSGGVSFKLGTFEV